jgi:hypothetical protein
MQPPVVALTQTSSQTPLSVESSHPAAVLRQRFMPVFLLAAVLPIIVLGAFLLINFLAHPEIGLRMLKNLPVHMIPFGSETSVALLVLQGIPLALIIFFLLLSDLATSLPFIALANGSRNVPILGRWVTRLEAKGTAFYAKHEWFRRLGALGLAGFVALPLAGTGSTMGVLIGRASGMPSLLVATCVAMGALLRWSLFVGAVAGASMLF